MKEYRLTKSTGMVATLHGVVAWLTSSPDLPFPNSPQTRMATDSGLPSSVIRLSTLTAIIASVVCLPAVLARSLAPMMHLYRYIPFSARA